MSDYFKLRHKQLLCCFKRSTYVLYEVLIIQRIAFIRCVKA